MPFLNACSFCIVMGCRYRVFLCPRRGLEMPTHDWTDDELRADMERLEVVGQLLAVRSVPEGPATHCFFCGQERPLRIRHLVLTTKGDE